MRKKDILIGLAGVVVGVLLSSVVVVLAGSLDSPGGPDSDAAKMYTLEDIYNRLDTGAAGVQNTFTEPAAGPGTGTMHDLNEIMAQAPAEDNTSGATTADVLTTKTYWSRRTADWGHQTGTMPDNGAVTITPTTTNQAIALGYHNGSGHVQGDADLVADKIKQGVDVFGVSGTVIEATGDATAGDVLTGKTFSKAGQAGINGAMPDNGAVTIAPTTTNQAIALGYHNGSGEVLGDTDLVSGNIKSGVDIFGVSGERHGGCTCTGTLNETRWCDNGDGTVTDLTTCLVWLKKADWGGQAPWRDPGSCWDAHSLAGILYSGLPLSELSDGSDDGDWRLPTFTELFGLANGTEGVRSWNMRAFTGVQSDCYWSSTNHDLLACDSARAITMNNGCLDVHTKTDMCYVWPVRGGQ